MTKRFQQITFDAAVAKQEVAEFKALLDKNQWLSEAKDILPFFKTRLHLSALVGCCTPNIVIPDMVGGEFILQGDFRCDLAIGQNSRNSFCIVEFEDATEFSLFENSDKAYRPFSKRFEQGMSQIIDWCYKLEDMKGSNDCENIFGCREPEYVGLLVTGRSQTMSDAEQKRFKWRGFGTHIRGHAIFALTFDELYEHAYERLNLC